jgi:hypothetical protein
VQVNNLISNIGRGGGQKADINSSTGAIQGSKIYGSRGITPGGGVPAAVDAAVLYNTMDYFSIAQGGSAVDFGDLVAITKNSGDTGDGYRGVSMGGKQGAAPGTAVNSMQYFNLLTPGNALTWSGVLQSAKAWGSASSNGHRAIFVGGTPPNWATNETQLDLFSMTSQANAVDYGEGTSGRTFASSCSDGARCLSADDYGNGSFKKTIDYFSFTTHSGTASDFGDLRNTLYEGCMTSNLNRAVHWNGSPARSYIDYMTISTPGNALDFGECTQAAGPFAGSDGSRAVQCSQAYSDYSAILYMNIGTFGDTVDYGELTQGRLEGDHCISGG